MKPKVSGFTIVRNGEKFDYPYLQSLSSMISVVDELVINVGIGDDQTLSKIKSWSESVQRRPNSPKILIFESDWQLEDPEKKKAGLILSEQTNLSLERCTGDWCLYLQADEVLHEQDIPNLQMAFEHHQHDPQVEALLFSYLHFYGSYGVIQSSRSAYRREVRAIKRLSGARSVGDAQSFRKANGEKLNAALVDARVYHYGWVRTPEAMKEKTVFMDRLYHGDLSGKGDLPETGYNYRYKRFWGLKQFHGTHPEVMMDRIRSKGWNWDLDASPFVWEWTDVSKIILDLFERLSGLRLFEYRCYRQVIRPVLMSNNESTPVASLLLATYEAPRHLALVLAGLARQSRRDFEIIVCDDGSGAQTRAVIESFKSKSMIALQHVWQEHQGFRKCKMLNEGLRRSRGSVLIFLDGDCVPHRDFVKDHIENQEYGTYLAGRRVELGRKISETLTVERVGNGFFDFPSLSLIASFLKGESEHFNRCFRFPVLWIRRLLKMDRIIDLKGCNYSVSRSDLLAINGFDEKYEGYGREDTDVEIRLQNLGLKIKSLKGLALQFHVWHPRREFTPANDSRLEELKRSRRTWCENGCFPGLRQGTQASSDQPLPIPR